MKRLCLMCVAVMAVLGVICLCCSAEGLSQESVSVDIAEAVICRDVVDHQPMDAGTRFPASVGTLFCFSKIIGATDASHVTHVWYYGNTERARITLPVKSSAWRTFSSKTIRLSEHGVWHVDVLDASGNRLEVLNFHVYRP